MSILILAGGPDAERDVSVAGAESVHAALEQRGVESCLETIDELSQEGLADFAGEVVFPLLHGSWGEGGPLQDLLLADGRPFVGAGARAARLAMDKVATKTIAASLGIPTTACVVVSPADAGCPFDLPVVVKPIREGSTLGLRICRSEDEWLDARAEALRSKRPTMVEPFVPGRELTVGWLDGRALPLIEVGAAEGLYDYAAKYERDDTTYTLTPSLPPGVAALLSDATNRLCAAVGIRHIARADFILDPAGTPWLLEINTMPGFTDHSLVPMAAASPGGGGLSLADLTLSLIEMARRDHARDEPPAPGGGRPASASDRKRTTKAASTKNTTKKTSKKTSKKKVGSGSTSARSGRGG